jgi:hypothetical protein
MIPAHVDTSKFLVSRPDVLKDTIFKLVRRRLVERSDSLQLFYRHWRGSSGGIEGWFKLEFAAAIDPVVAIVHTGGAGGRGRKGMKCPDYLLETKDGPKLQVELKAAGSSWYYDGRHARAKYPGHLLAFLAPSQDPLPVGHRQQVEALDKNVQVAPICNVQDTEGKKRTFYFGIADFRG